MNNKPIRPPLGLMPSEVWIQLRIEDIESAIKRYKAHKMSIPYKWYNELENLKRKIKEVF